MNLKEISALSESGARALLEQIRWPNGPVCPHKPHDEQNVTKLHGKAHREGVYKCNVCRKQFTVTVGTLFERSHIPLRTWLMAFSILCAAKKGISALQLQRQLGLGSYQAAWHMAHRIRHAMSQEPLAGLLKGGVEVDETYIGGKPRKGRPAGKRGRGTTKPPVVVLVERDGRARARAVERVNAKTLKGAIRENVDHASRIYTDEFSAYWGIGHEFAYGHMRVDHSKGEYAQGEAHTNTAESFFALLKRGITGSFHHISKQHLDRYCNEFSYRWNHRKETDGERMIQALRLTDGCRLMYRDPIGIKGQ